jgi:hypothetical protein
MFDLDDENTDRLDFLADRHWELFEYLDNLMDEPEGLFLDDWQNYLTEPSPEELELIDLNAQMILLDMEN